MFVTGIGRTKFGILNKSLHELLYDAIYKALHDSSRDIEDIDIIIVANFLSGCTQSQLHLGSVVSSLLPGLNLPAYRIEAACASGGLAIYQALSMSEKFNNILVVGGERLNTIPNKDLTKNIAMAGDFLRDQQEGLIFPAQYAFVASQYFKKYGATHNDLALVTLKNYANASKNPLAHFNYKDISLDTINSSQMICSPLRLYDCCAISDGAAAIILSREKKTDRDIEIIGAGARTDSISLSNRKDFTGFASTRLAAKYAYNMAKIRPKDVDIAELHDCFSIAELIAMEDLGFCKIGEGIGLIQANETTLSGSLPINTDGGLLGDGHPIGATGIAQIYEIVEQLRGESKYRQIHNAKFGLTHNVGGVGGTAVVLILEGPS